jgi:hypothetical protein
MCIRICQHLIGLGDTSVINRQSTSQPSAHSIFRSTANWSLDTFFESPSAAQGYSASSPTALYRESASRWHDKTLLVPG